MDIGSHCSVGACSQVDFLPFACDCCRSVFCLAHRTYDAHACPLAGSKDRRVIDCPLCGALLHWTSEQDVDAVWAAHVQGGACSSATESGGGRAQSTPKKPRCGAAGCRELLTASNQFRCAKCRQSVCLKHRFESDHDCENARRAHQRQWGQPRPSSRLSGAGNAAAAQQHARKAAATVVSGTKSAVSALVQNAKAAAATSTALVTTASEECPMCQKKFAYVSQLIAHVNQAHPDTRSRGSASSSASAATAASAASSTSVAAAAAAPAGGREVCPQCRADFRDLSALIQHAERAHAPPVAAATAGGRRPGEPQDKCSVM